MLYHLLSEIFVFRYEALCILYLHSTTDGASSKDKDAR